MRTVRQVACSLALLSSLFGGAAHAASLEFGVAYGRAPAGVWAGVDVRDLSALGGQVSAGVSTRAAHLGYARSLSLPPVGAASVQSDALVTWQGGLRLSTHASGSAGPLAVTAGAAYFTAPVTAADPLATFALEALDLRDRGFSGDLGVRYRVSREVVAVVGAEFGAQPQVFAGAEIRRPLTRLVPLQLDGPGDPSAVGSAPPAMAPGADGVSSNPDATGPDTAGADAASADAASPDTASPDAAGADGISADGTGAHALPDAADPQPAPETETVGTLSWRAGARAGVGVLALTGGVGYATPEGLSLSLDALLGPGPNARGLTFSASAPDLLGTGSEVRAYAAYEPWRTVSAPLRVGAGASVPAGPGTLDLSLAGGRTLGGAPGFAVRVSYAWPLDPAR